MICHALKAMAFMFVLCLLAMFNPYFYSITPAKESEICLCEFYQLPKAPKRNFWYTINEVRGAAAFLVLQYVNLIVFYLLNWVFLFALITMGLKIRYIKDGLSLVTELTTVVIIWTLCNILAFVLFLAQ